MLKNHFSHLSRVVIVLALFMTACTEDAGNEPPAPAPTLPIDYTPTPSAGCGHDLDPGLHVFNINHGGYNRTYDVIIPAGYDNMEPLPMLMNLHSFTLGGSLHAVWAYLSNFNIRADQYGFVVVHPDGTGDPAAWNGGLQCCTPPESDVDDVDFIAALIETVKSQVCIDERRVTGVGMSNGAYMAYRIACEEPDLFAAIAPIAGSLSSELVCTDGRAVPVYAISGSEDNLASRQASVDTFLSLNACTETTEVSYNVGDVTCTTHTDCDDDATVTHCIVDGGGHCFYGDHDDLLVSVGCDVRNDITSQDLVWDFLSRQWLP